MNTTTTNQNGGKFVPKRAPAPAAVPAPAISAKPASAAAQPARRTPKASNDTTLAKIGIAVAAIGVTFGGWALASNQMTPAATTVATTSTTASSSTTQSATTLRQVTVAQTSNTSVLSVATTRSSQ